MCAMPPGDDVEPVNNLGRRQQLIEERSHPLRHRCHHPSRLCCRHHRLPLCYLLSAVAHCHHDRAAIPPSIALPPPLPIKIVPPPSPSPITAASVHGDCHHNRVAVSPPVEPPPLLPNAIMPPLLPSLFVTPSSPIVTTVAHHDHAAVPPSMALLPLSPTAIALLSCNPASPLDALPPLHMPAGCHVGLVVIASSLITPPPLKAPARCPRRLSMHNPLVCPGWLSHHLAAATASQCAGLLSPRLSSRHPLVCPAWLSHHPSSRHHLSTRALHVRRRQSLLLIVIIVLPLCRRLPRWSKTAVRLRCSRRWLVVVSSVTPLPATASSTLRICQPRRCVIVDAFVAGCRPHVAGRLCLHLSPCHLLLAVVPRCLLILSAMVGCRF
jgi:hypothetical protein